MAKIDPEALADVVVDTMLRAITPVSADVKVLQAQMAERESILSDLGAIRERLAVIESKDYALKADIGAAFSAKAIDPAELLALVMKRMAA